MNFYYRLAKVVWYLHKPLNSSTDGFWFHHYFFLNFYPSQNQEISHFSRDISSPTFVSFLAIASMSFWQNIWNVWHVLVSFLLQGTYDHAINGSVIFWRGHYLLRIDFLIIDSLFSCKCFEVNDIVRSSVWTMHWWNAVLCW